ncbi:MAG: hypothetical protein ABID87_07945, partial [Chloroflexota bacterium]
GNSGKQEEPAGSGNSGKQEEPAGNGNSGKQEQDNSNSGGADKGNNTSRQVEERGSSDNQYREALRDIIERLQDARKR